MWFLARHHGCARTPSSPHLHLLSRVPDSHSGWQRHDSEMALALAGGAAAVNVVVVDGRLMVYGGGTDGTELASGKTLAPLASSSNFFLIWFISALLICVFSSFFLFSIFGSPFGAISASWPTLSSHPVPFTFVVPRQGLEGLDTQLTLWRVLSGRETSAVTGMVNGGWCAGVMTSNDRRLPRTSSTRSPRETRWVTDSQRRRPTTVT